MEQTPNRISDWYRPMNNVITKAKMALAASFIAFYAMNLLGPAAKPSTMERPLYTMSMDRDDSYSQPLGAVLAALASIVPNNAVIECSTPFFFFVSGYILGALI